VLIELANRLTAGEVMRIGYGIEVQEENDPFIATAKHAAEALFATFNPGSYFVDLLPIRKSPTPRLLRFGS
jgi:hypothetical protein